LGPQAGSRFRWEHPYIQGKTCCQCCVFCWLQLRMVFELLSPRRKAKGAYFQSKWLCVGIGFALSPVPTAHYHKPGTGSGNFPSRSGALGPDSAVGLSMAYERAPVTFCDGRALLSAGIRMRRTHRPRTTAPARPPSLAVSCTNLSTDCQTCRLPSEELGVGQIWGFTQQKIRPAFPCPVSRIQDLTSGLRLGSRTSCLACRGSRSGRGSYAPATKALLKATSRPPPRFACSFELDPVVHCCADQAPFGRVSSVHGIQACLGEAFTPKEHWYGGEEKRKPRSEHTTRQRAAAWHRGTP
jgi:hypothetical protein